VKLPGTTCLFSHGKGFLFTDLISKRGQAKQYNEQHQRGHLFPFLISSVMPTIHNIFFHAGLDPAFSSFLESGFHRNFEKGYFYVLN
jgi:hypothetical protein